MNRASASFASSGIAGRDVVLVHHEPVPLAEQRVGDPHRLSELLLGRLGKTDVVPFRLAHELLVPGDEQLDGERDLRLLPVGLLHLAAHEEVVELVGAAELDVGLDRHRVVPLHDRVQELRDRDRRLLREALGEVVALEQPGDGRRPRQPDDLRVVELAEPLAVEPQLRAFRVDDRRRLLEVPLRVAIDLLVRRAPAA